MKQALRNQDVGIREFREMVFFTQKGNECLAEITTIGHCAKKGFARNPFIAHVERITETGVKEEKTKKHWFFRSLKI